MLDTVRTQGLRLLTIAIAVTLIGGCGGMGEAPLHRLEIRGGWSLIAAADCVEDGAAISTVGYKAKEWVGAQTPATVLGALVADGRYPDLYFADNLERVPREQFEGAWWYRTEFEVPAAEVDRVGRLVLEGVNYSANVWLNGQLVADRDTIVGAFRIHEIEIPGRVQVGANALAIEVFPPEAGDFTIGFVDWNPTPPDRNMGLWRPVALRLHGPVSIDDVYVSSDVDLETLGSADLEVSGIVVNHSAEPVDVRLRGELEGAYFGKSVRLDPHERRAVTFSAAQFPVLHLDSPRLWWPHTIGEPNLYSLNLSVESDGVSDAVDVTFGVREVASYLNPEGHRGFTVNGKPVLIRGGGWVDDLLLADTPDKIAAQMQYVKHMGLNTVRLEGFWGSGPELYDIADREGILLMPGWSCQWEWEEYLGKPVDEYGGVKTPEEMDLVARSLADQVRWLRNHPSVFTWVLASDMLPRPELEKRYNVALEEVDPHRPSLSTCAWLESEVSGPSGVKMNGPYEWVPPTYWFEDTEHGGAYGFNTETGPGAQPPPLESLKRMLPEPSLWPIDDLWAYHCGRNEFNTPDRYVEALDARYGPSETIEEFLLKAQVANYEAIRPMFEAFAAKRPVATGVIQWMLNSAWPEMFWQLYDHYLVPNGAFYGTRAACQPNTAVYDYADRAVWAINESAENLERVEVAVRAFDLDASEILSVTHTVDVDPGVPVKVVGLDDLELPSPVWFLDLRVRSSEGVELGRNFYWLARQTDELDYPNSKWFYTPLKRPADFTALEQLPTVELDVATELAEVEQEWEATVSIENPSEDLAFFVDLRLVDPETRDLLVPVLWQDNYFSLLPGERRELKARVPKAESGAVPELEVSGWNVATASYELNPF